MIKSWNKELRYSLKNSDMIPNSETFSLQKKNRNKLLDKLELNSEIDYLVLLEEGCEQCLI